MQPCMRPTNSTTTETTVMSNRKSTEVPTNVMSSDHEGHTDKHDECNSGEGLSTYQATVAHMLGIRGPKRRHKRIEFSSKRK